MTLKRLLAFFVVIAWCAAGGLAFAQKAAPAKAAAKAPTNDDCLACHGDASLTGAGGRPVAVAPEKFAASIHGQSGQACVACHADLATVTEFPHAEKLAPVNCAACHDEPGKQYDAGVHAQARRSSAASVAAACKDCHGTHEIRTAKDPESSTYHLNLPATCGHCHGNPDIIKKGRITIGNVVAQFQDSIHGQALSRSGLLSAPNCSDCHGFHDIKRKNDSTSRVFRGNVPETCGKCHEGITRRYMTGIHGQELVKGNPEAPVCVKCHSAHEIQRVEAGSWRLQVLKECGTCHKQSIRTYRDTFHGQVTQLGFVRVATCADCHGAHDIFPKRDPRSTVSSANLVATCRKCHTGATTSFAKYDPHADRHDRARNPLLYYAARFMETLLVGVFLFFGVHTALWFSRSVPMGRSRGAGRTEE
jgi:hypothetical protein